MVSFGYKYIRKGTEAPYCSTVGTSTWTTIGMIRRHVSYTHKFSVIKSSSVH
jgi:hypothetical protein